MIRQAKEASMKPQVEDYRKGRKSMTVWIEPDVIRTIKLIAADQGRPQQEIVMEAFTLLFRKYKIKDQGSVSCT
jgi:hypothetical protein